MMIRQHPDPALRQKCAEVDPVFDRDLPGLVKKLATAMYDAPGVGLAAPQLGVQKRVIVYDIDERLEALCNPVISDRSEETAVDDEGCLSLPGITVPVARSLRIVCEATKPGGDRMRIEAAGIEARVLQHECDHLDGVLILDRTDPEARKAAIRRYMEQRDAS